jgi:hypothetical protein
MKDDLAHLSLHIIAILNKACFTLGVKADVQPKSIIPIGAKVEVSPPNDFTLGVKSELEKVLSIGPKLLLNAELYGLVFGLRLEKGCHCH